MKKYLSKPEERYLPPPGEYYEPDDLIQLFDLKDGAFCVHCFQSPPHLEARSAVRGCQNKCGACGTRDHQGLECPMIYCTGLWWHQQGHQPNSNVQILPSRDSKDVLSKKGIIEASSVRAGDPVIPRWNHAVVQDFYRGKTAPTAVKHRKTVMESRREGANDRSRTHTLQPPSLPSGPKALASKLQSPPERYLPPAGDHYAQPVIEAMAGKTKKRHVKFCAHCLGPPHILSQDPVAGCTRPCGVCKTQDHQGKECPMIYCCHGWWLDLGHTPGSKVQLRPTLGEVDVLADMGLVYRALGRSELIEPVMENPDVQNFYQDGVLPRSLNIDGTVVAGRHGNSIPSLTALQPLPGYFASAGRNMNLEGPRNPRRAEPRESNSTGAGAELERPKTPFLERQKTHFLERPKAPFRYGSDTDIEPQLLQMRNATTTRPSSPAIYPERSVSPSKTISSERTRDVSSAPIIPPAVDVGRSSSDHTECEARIQQLEDEAMQQRTDSMQREHELRQRNMQLKNEMVKKDREIRSLKNRLNDPQIGSMSETSNKRQRRETERYLSD